MDDKWNGKDRRHIKLLFALGCLVLLLVATAVALMHFLVQVHSEACQSGLRAEEKCRNVTNHLRSQLSMAWQVWREDQTTCNRTMVSRETPAGSAEQEGGKPSPETAEAPGGR